MNCLECNSKTITIRHSKLDRIYVVVYNECENCNWSNHKEREAAAVEQSKADYPELYKPIVINRPEGWFKVAPIREIKWRRVE